MVFLAMALTTVPGQRAVQPVAERAIEQNAGTGY